MPLNKINQTKNFIDNELEINLDIPNIKNYGKHFFLKMLKNESMQNKVNFIPEVRIRQIEYM